MSDSNAPSATATVPTTTGFGTFDEEGNYTPREVVADDLGMSFADAIDGTMVEVEDGQLVNGTIVKIDKDEVLLDIGYKSEGVIPSRELSIRNDVDPHEIVTLGEKVEALVLTKEDKEGRLVLSKKRAQYERAWGTIEKLKEEDGVVEGPVIEVVKGGLIVDIGLRGFLPASLVELRRVRDLQPYVGQRISAKIIELDKNRNNVVLSRRAHLEETQKESRDQFLNNLKVGEVRHGTVSSVVSFGAFVDLGGMDGLIHVSELSWKHVDHPGSVVAVGDEVDVQVLDVDMSRERISLSLKATQQDPWQEFASTHEVGQLVYGRVTKLVQFGAFVQVGDGIEGLVHISEMSTHHVDSPGSGRHARARSCGSRSSTSTSPAGGSACRSSRPPRVASWPRSTASTSRSTSTATGRPVTPTPSARPRGRSTTATRQAARAWPDTVLPDTRAVSKKVFVEPANAVTTAAVRSYQAPASVRWRRTMRAGTAGRLVSRRSSRSVIVGVGMAHSLSAPRPIQP